LTCDSDFAINLLKAEEISMTVVYEWCAEEIAEWGDCLGLYFYKSRKEAEKHTEFYSMDCVKIAVCLIREVYDGDALEDRQWAYVVNEKMPQFFDGGAKVPKKFL
jgi:hypothetical protein